MIELELPSLPISINRAYTHTLMSKGGGRVVVRILTAAGRKYKEESISHLARNYPKELNKIEKNKPYLVYITLYLEDLVVKGWPNKAKSRYKKLDATNCIKLLEDVLAEVSAVDDSNNLVVVVQKKLGPERTVIRIWDLEDEDTPFDAGIRAQ